MKAKNQNHTSRRLFKDLLSQKGLVLGATLGTIAQVALTVYLPILIGNAVDVVLSPKSISLIVPIVVKMSVVVALNTLVQWVNPLIYNRLTFGYIYTLRQKVMEKLCPGSDNPGSCGIRLYGFWRGWWTSSSSVGWWTGLVLHSSCHASASRS